MAIEPRQPPLPKDEKPSESGSGETPPAGENGGRGGLDPTRYGDWEIGGRCVDF